MSQEYPKKGDNYGQFSMKINGCPLFAHKYRTMVDKSEGACLSALKFPNILIINMLGFFIIAICTIIVRSDVKSQKNLTQKFKTRPPIPKIKSTFLFWVAFVK